MGCVFWPIKSARLLRGDFEGHVAGLLLGAGGTTLRAGTPALEGRPLVDKDLRDDEVVDVFLALVLGVGDGRHDELEELFAAGLGEETKAVNRRRDVLAADHVRNHAHLARRDADLVELSGRHGYFLPFLSPA